MLKEILSPDQILLHYFFFRIGLQIKGHTSVLSAYSLVIACEESSCFLFWWLVFHIFVPSVNIWERKKDFSSCPYDLMSDAWIFENGFFGYCAQRGLDPKWNKLSSSGNWLQDVRYQREGNKYLNNTDKEQLKPQEAPLKTGRGKEPNET